MDTFVLLQSLIKLFSILILGYFLNKRGFFDAHTNQQLSKLVSSVTAPLLVISSVLNAEGTTAKGELLAALGIGFILYPALILMAILLTKLLRVPKDQTNMYRFMLAFSNYSFLGYPILEATLGSDAIFLAALLHFPCHMLIYSYGMNGIRADKADDSEKKVKFSPRLLLHPGTIMSTIAVIIFLAGWSFPALINDTVAMIGGLTSPLSMIVIGSTLAEFSIRECGKDGRIYLMAICRLFLLPVLFFYLFRLFGSNDYLSMIALITIGMPSASMSVMFANTFGVNQKTAAHGVLITTAASVVTIPILVTLLF